MRPEPAIGDVFAGYRIERVAGRGGMGTVYLATQLALERQVALKVIAAALAEDISFRERFMRESRVAAGLDHPHIVPVFHAGEEDGLLFIAMRFVEGTDLRAVIQQERALDPARAARIVAQIGFALDAAHARGLVHRDVKPGNVLLGDSSEREHAYLSDFGLTKHSTSVGGITETGQWVGTLDYVAPEQIRGEPADARADIYALGAVLFQALTGRVPFPQDNDAAKLYAHLATDPPPCRELNPAIPAAFEEVVGRALAKDPAERYPSAGDLGRAARAAARGAVVNEPERSMARGAAAAPGEEALTPLPLPAPTRAPTSDRTIIDRPVPEEATGSAGSTTGAGTAARSSVPIAIACVAAALVVIALLAVFVLPGGDDSKGDGGDPNVSSLAVGSSPSDVAAGPSGVWVALSGGGELARVDASGKHVSTRVKVPDRPFRVVVDSGGAWAAAALSGRVSRIDGSSGKLAEPHAMLDGDIFAIAVDDHGLWVTERSGAGPLTKKPTVVAQVDPHTGRTVGTSAPVGKGPTELAAGAGYVWAANAAAATVARIDPESGAMLGTPRKVANDVSAIAAGAEGVWIVDADSAVASRLDRDGGGVSTTVKLGGRPIDVAVGGGSAWVLDGRARTLVEIDAKAGKVVARTKLPDTPTAVAVDSSAVWIANAGDGTVSRLALSDAGR